MSLTEIRERLVARGLKATHQRIVLLQALCNYEGHPSAEHIFDMVSTDNPSLSLSTVYRVLEDFEKCGLIYKVATRAGIKRYDANLTPHNHIYCTETHDIYDFYAPELNEMIARFFRERSIENFKITDIKLQVNGCKLSPKDKVVFNNHK